MPKVAKHLYIPLLPKTPRKRYYEKLEAELVTFPKSLVPSLKRNTLRYSNKNSPKSKPKELNDNKPSSSTGQNCTEQHRCSSITQLTPEPQLYFVWSATDATSLRTELLDDSSYLSKSIYFALNTSDLPLPSCEVEHPHVKTPLNILHVINIHTLFSNLSPEHKAYETNDFEPVDKNPRYYTKYELKQIWFYLKSEETFDKLVDFQSLEIDTILKKQPVRRLYWLFKTYQCLYWLAISYCYVEQLNTTAAETAVQCCCKMSQELLEREKVYMYSEHTEKEANILCLDWENNNRNFKKSDFYGLICTKAYDVKFKWKNCTPEWVQKMFTQDNRFEE